MRMTGTHWLVAMIALAGGTARAQVAEHKELTLAGARNAIDGAIAFARTRAGTGVIAVVDAGGNLMALERLDGTFSAGAEISIGKARTAVKFKKPTRFFEELINKGRTAMTRVEGFTPLIGGVPILIDGEVVGGIGVSGAASAAEDEELAMAGASAVTAMTSAMSAPNPVSFFSHDQVAAAFAKGSVLLDGTGRNYMVHASRREKAGPAEVHLLDTDVIYVQEGSATLITGGTLESPTTVEPGELRGPTIQGGESRQIHKGDVITVPNNTPHWFQDLKGPLTYYVVKVRG